MVKLFIFSIWLFAGTAEEYKGSWPVPVSYEECKTMHLELLKTATKEDLEMWNMVSICEEIVK